MGTLDAILKQYEQGQVQSDRPKNNISIEEITKERQINKFKCVIDAYKRGLSTSQIGRECGKSQPTIFTTIQILVEKEYIDAKIERERQANKEKNDNKICSKTSIKSSDDTGSSIGSSTSLCDSRKNIILTGFFSILALIK